MRGLPIVIAVAGCGTAALTGAAHPEATPETSSAPRGSSPGLPPSPAGFASSDVVTMSGGELSTWKLVSDRLVNTGRVVLVDEPDAGGNGEWADRDHLFIEIGEKRVVMVTAHAITFVQLPLDSTFEIPKPPALSNVARGAGVDMNTLAVTDGEAYWSHCAWGEPFGAFFCRSWVHARLWPAPGILRDQPQLPTRSWRWAAVPAGYATTTAPLAVSCSGPQGTTVIAADPDDPYVKVAEVEWVSSKPPRLLIKWGDDGPLHVAAWRWTLHDGCNSVPIATGDQATPGPRGLWVGTEREKPSTIHRGADAIGEVPELSSVWFRPPRG